MNDNIGNQPKGNIIIVDDIPANLRLLANMLTEQGYFVRPIRDPKQAFSFIASTKPDLILLDIKMPNLNGYQVCQKLKSDARTQHIPVIFLSALNEAIDKVKAFSVGGVDYITKPFQVEEVLARVELHLGVQQLQQSLNEKNQALEKSNQKLVELNASKDKLFAIISHDLKSPFQGLLASAEWLSTMSSTLSKEEVKFLAGEIHIASQLTYKLLDNLLEWSLLQRDEIPYQPKDINLKSLADCSLELLQKKASEKAIHLSNEIAPDIEVTIDQKMIDTVFRNLISNALKFTSTDGKIQVTAQKNNKTMVEVAVIDTGIGISPLDIKQILQPNTYFSTPGIDEERGTGLGFTLCREMVNRNGGHIWVESELGVGTQVKFTLPIIHPV